MSRETEVEIFTDGACSGNPGPGGWGAILRVGNRERELSGGDPATTNNRMELMAAIMALEALKRPCKVRLFTDTNYGAWIVNTMSIAVWVAVITLLAAVPAGYALARLRIPGAENFGIAIFMTYLVGAIVSPMTGWAIARLGRRPFILAVIAAWAVGALLMLAAPIAAITAGLVLCAACGMLCQTIATGYVAASAKEGRSSAVGLYVTSFYIGGTFGGLLPGLAYEAGGWTYSLALVIAMLAIMAAIVWTSWRDAYDTLRLRELKQALCLLTTETGQAPTASCRRRSPRLPSA